MLRRQVEHSNRQLAQYSRDLNQLVERERHRAQQLEDANGQLKSYARDLQMSVERERVRVKEIEKAYHDTVVRLTNASAYKDKETGAHIQRLSHYAKILALEIGMSEEQAQLIFDAAPMHDLGKIGVPDSILNKEGPLDAEETAKMRQHVLIGANLLEGSHSPLLEMGRLIAIAHHERWDGTGYPFGLRGEQIPLPARIVAIADTYDALRSVRPYKPGFSHARSCQIILEGDGRTMPEHFDPEILRAFGVLHPRMAEIFDAIADPPMVFGGAGRVV